MRLLTAVLLPVLAAPPGLAATLDASEHLPETPSRERCRLGPCPVFAATSVVSAAIRRRHGRIRDQVVEVSEADLFLRRALADRRAQAQAASALSVEGRPPDPARLEARWPKSDVDLLLAEGALTRKTLSWDDLWRRYDAEKARVEADAEAAYAECLERSAAPSAYTGMAACPSPLLAGRDRAREFLESLRRENAERALRPETGEAALHRQEREWVRLLTRGFRVEERSYLLNTAVLGPRFYDDVETCRRRGEDARAFILAQLAAGRPVLLGVNVEGLKAWRGGSAEDWRPILVSGALTNDAQRTLSLATWLEDGEPGPLLLDEHLCRVGQALSVLTDAER